MEKEELRKFGNEFTIAGMVMKNSDDNAIVIMLPQEVLVNIDEIKQPDAKEWFEILEQLDICEVEGIRNDQKVILRKGQRNIDSRVSWKVFKRDNYACRYCGINNVPLTVDHIICWEVGGATHPSNLLTACSKCNKKKSNLDYGSWLQHKYYIERSEKYLTPTQRKANENIVKNLSKLPTVNNIRSR